MSDDGLRDDEGDPRGDSMPLLSPAGGHEDERKAGGVVAMSAKGRAFSAATPVGAHVDGEDDDKPPSASVGGSVFNLSNSMLGGGISLIALPLAAREAGFAGFTLLVAMSALFTQVSVQLLADAAVAAGAVEPAADYGEVAAAALGAGGETAVEVFVLLNNFGVGVSLLNTFGDVVPGEIGRAAAHVAGGTAGHAALEVLSRRDVVVPAVAAFVLLPAAVAARRIESLRFVSLAALAVSLAFVCFMIVVAHDKHVPLSFWRSPPESVLGFLQALSVVSFAFTCHFNVVPLLHALPRPAAQFPGVVRASTAASALVYWVVGVLGAFSHPDSPYGDILKDYRAYPGAIGFRTALAVMVAASFPLFAYEGTLTLQALTVDRLASSRSMGRFLRRVIAATVFTAATAATSVAVPKTGVAIAFVGAAFAIPIMYVFPPLLYGRLVTSGARRRAARATLVAGCVICAGCVASSVAGVV